MEKLGMFVCVRERERQVARARERESKYGLVNKLQPPDAKLLIIIKYLHARHWWNISLTLTDCGPPHFI